MCFFLLMQVAVAASAQEVSCSAGDADCSGDNNVLIQKRVVATSGDCPEWSYDYTQFSNSMTLTVLVEIDGQLQSEGVLAAFMDGKVRGLEDKPNPPPFGPNKGKPFFGLMVHGSAGDNGKKVTYKFKGPGCTITELEHDPKYDYKDNGTYGNVMNQKIVFKGSTGGGAEVGLPACKADDPNWHALPGWGCNKLKAWCIGFAEQMKEHCQTTCKGKLPGLKCS
jgi:hypothetical protein